MSRPLLFLLACTLALLCYTPGSAQLPGPRLAVSCGLDDSLALVDARTIRVQGRLQVCRDPGDVAVSPDGRLLVVAESTGAGLALVDLQQARVIAPVRSEHLVEPRGMAFSADGARLYLLSGAARALLELHVPSFKTIRLMPLQVAGTRDLALSRDGSRLFVSHRETGVISAVDLVGWQLLGQHRVAERIGGVDVTADGTRVLVALPDKNVVGLYQAEGFAPAGEVPVGQGAAEVRVGPDGRAVVINSMSNDVSVFDPDRPAGRFRIGVGVGPRALAFSPDGRACFVANYDTGDLSVLDLDAGRQLGRLAVGKGPRGVAWVP